MAGCTNTQTITHCTYPYPLHTTPHTHTHIKVNGALWSIVVFCAVVFFFCAVCAVALGFVLSPQHKRVISDDDDGFFFSFARRFFVLLCVAVVRICEPAVRVL